MGHGPHSPCTATVNAAVQDPFAFGLLAEVRHKNLVRWSV